MATIPITGNLETVGGVVTFTPTNILPSETLISCEITTGMRGTENERMTEALSFSFTTAETVELEHISNSPENGAFCCPVDSTISMTFDADIDPDTVIGEETVMAIGWYASETNEEPVPYVTVDGDWTVDDATITFTPTDDLPNAYVLVGVVSTGIRGLLGELLVEETATMIITIGEEMDDPAMLPVHQAINIAVDTTITATFDTDIMGNSVISNTFIVTYDDGL